MGPGNRQQERRAAHNTRILEKTNRVNPDPSTVTELRRKQDAMQEQLYRLTKCYADLHASETELRKAFNKLLRLMKKHLPKFLT